MKSILMALLIATAAGPGQAGTVEVLFVDPDGYADAGGHLGDAQRYRDELTRLLDQLGARWLPAEQSLRVEFLNIDLAGEIRVTPRANNPRVLRGRADWPRFELRYLLRSGEQVLASGQESLADMSYMGNPDTNPIGNGDESLPYEKRMLSRWFVRRFGGAVP